MKLLIIGTDTTIFRPDSDARSRIEAYGRLFDELHIVIYTAPGFRVEALQSGARLYPTNSRFFFRRPFDAVRIGKTIVRERGIDAVSVQDPAESGLAGWLIKRSTGVPLHIQLHADVLSPYFRHNSWKDRLRYGISRFTIPRGDAFRVVSARLAHSLASVFGIPAAKVVTLPIFVDREAIASTRPTISRRERYPDFDFIVLMVSRLNRDKRIDVALEAFAEFRREFPRAGLVIVGEGPERRSIESQIQNLALTGGVWLEGWQDDLVSYYKTADLYLLTSAFEGYGRTVIEAAAAGAPVVMTDVGVAGEIIRDGETGRVVPVGDSRALAQALADARRNYPAMQAMAERARAEVLVLSPLTWQEYLERYRAAFHTIMNLH
ncbi:MAG: glycosyltransferase [Candidatus Sungbacteria bacterium]|uniref:Glycosyltransferase n=1 Tax=Candidatus Sungiibacteriota bacterium TaxID=2750080 RepID=A0A932YY20_9BACT|nr:glycosyltransferase [Candidatus Sungbacteria bacterium]